MDIVPGDANTRNSTLPAANVAFGDPLSVRPLLEGIMRRFVFVAGAVVLAAAAWGSIATACGDKFLAPGRGPSLCALSKPPHKIAVLIYGDPSSAAVSAVTSAEYRKTLAMVGYKVTTCTSSEECLREMKDKKFDVVLADAKDAQAVKEQTGSNVVPLLHKASKDEIQQARATYGQAFDASGGSLKLLPVINRAATQPQQRATQPR